MFRHQTYQMDFANPLMCKIDRKLMCNAANVIPRTRHDVDDTTFQLIFFHGGFNRSSRENLPTHKDGSWSCFFYWGSFGVFIFGNILLRCVLCFATLARFGYWAFLFLTWNYKIQTRLTLLHVNVIWKRRFNDF